MQWAFRLPGMFKEPVYIDCPECNGVGYFYYTEDGDRPERGGVLQ